MNCILCISGLPGAETQVLQQVRSCGEGTYLQLSCNLGWPWKVLSLLDCELIGREPQLLVAAQLWKLKRLCTHGHVDCEYSGHDRRL